MSSLSAREALARASRPAARAASAAAGDVSLDGLVLDGRPLRARISQVITSAELVRSIEGASTLTLRLIDPDWDLLAAGFFNRRSVLTLDTLSYELVRVAPGEQVIELTFEDREVALLRRYDEPRKASRDAMTRAQFVRSLVREVSEARIGFYAPDLDVRQPISSGDAPAPVGDAEREAERRPGIDAQAPVTVKGEPADAEQRALLQRSLDVAVAERAPRAAMVSLVMALTQESTARNLTHGHSSSVGPLQLLNSHLGGSDSTSGGRRDVALVARMYLTRGFTGKGGAIALAGQGLGPAEIAARVQGNAGGASDYAPWQAEAERTVDAYGGAGFSGAPASSAAAGAPAPFEFTRGTPGERETSWDAIRRLAEEVGWRAFMVAGVLYFISDERLFASKPRMRLHRRSPGVDEMGFEWDIGRKVAEARIIARAGRWAAPPGSVVVLERSGPANGRWLVSEIRRPSLYDERTEIVLTKPAPSLPEPAPERGAAEPGVETAGAGAGTGELAGVRAIGPYQGTQAIFEGFINPFMVRQGLRVGSTKRTPAQNSAVGGAPGSDHLTTNTNAYAVDYPTTAGAPAATALAAALGITGYRTGTYDRHVVVIDGRRFSVQILWAVAGHWDHIHGGVRAI